MDSLFRATRLGLTVLIALTIGQVASAGTLRIGTPTIEADQYTFPILLESGRDVAALNFRLEFDPAVFQAAAAQTGTAAEAARKNVSGHAPHDGAYNVVLMGFNQTALDGGEVARVTLSRIGGEEGARVSLTGQTLAAPNGDEVPSQGDTAVVAFEPPAGSDAPDADTPEDETPDEEEAGTQTPPESDTPADEAPAVSDSPAASGPTSAGSGLAGVGGLDQSGVEVLTGAAPADADGRFLRERDRRTAQMRVEDAIAEARSGGVEAGGTRASGLPSELPASRSEGGTPRNHAAAPPDGTPQAAAMAAVTVEPAQPPGAAAPESARGNGPTSVSGAGEGLTSGGRWWPVGIAALAASVVLALVGWRLYA